MEKTMAITTKKGIEKINFPAEDIELIRKAEEAAKTDFSEILKNGKKRFTAEQFKAVYGVTVSKRMGGKMHRVYAISTSVLLNPCCQARTKCDGMICKECYAGKALHVYPDAKAAYERNTAVLTNVLIPVDHLPKLTSPSGYFRFEAHGELVNEIQVANYFNMAAVNPQLRFALWTKNPWIVKAAMAAYNLVKPANLVIVGSSYYIDKAMRFDAFGFIDKVFTVYSLDFAKNNGITINCGSRDCAGCGRCYENKGGRSVCEMLKADQKKAGV